MTRAAKRDLEEALVELISVTPEEHTKAGVRCHHCLAAAGKRHDDDCPWIEAVALVSGDDQVRRIRVGEDEEDFVDRLADEDDGEEERESVRRTAASARRELAELLGELPGAEGLDPLEKRRLGQLEPPPDLIEALLDDPLDEPEPFEPED